MIRRMLYRAWLILREADPEPVEALVGGSVALVGLLLLILPDQAISPVFTLLSQVAPESTWVIITLLAGLLQFFAMLADHLRWRRASAMIMVVLLVLLTTLFTIANHHIITTMFLLMSMAEAWVYLRLKPYGTASPL